MPYAVPVVLVPSTLMLREMRCTHAPAMTALSNASPTVISVADALVNVVCCVSFVLSTSSMRSIAPLFQWAVSAVMSVSTDSTVCPCASLADSLTYLCTGSAAQNWYAPLALNFMA